jgi:hypothetical protein
MMSRYCRRLPRHLLPLIERDRDWIADVIRSGNVKAFAYAWGQTGRGTLPQLGLHWSFGLCEFPDFHARIVNWLLGNVEPYEFDNDGFHMAIASCNPIFLPAWTLGYRYNDADFIAAVNSGDIDILTHVVKHYNFYDRVRPDAILAKAVLMGFSEVEIDRISLLFGYQERGRRFRNRAKLY